MSAEKKYTERDIVLAKRKAFDAGFTAAQRWLPYEGNPSWPRTAKLAADRYPLPRVTRPRVAQTEKYEYRVVDGVVEFRQYGDSDFCWRPEPVGYCTAAAVRAIADLLANPTETVEDEA